MSKPRICGECKWWKPWDVGSLGECFAREDEPTPLNQKPCPAFDDGSFDKAVRDMLAVTPAPKPGTYHGKATATVERLLAERESRKGEEKK